MLEATLTIDGVTRPLLNLSYEYFRSHWNKQNDYTDFLRKNFPYESGDEWGVMHAPVLRHITAREWKMAEDARWKSRSSGGSIFDTSGRKKAYYEELTRLRYDARMDRCIIPNLSNLYDMESRLSEIGYAYRPPASYAGGLFELEFESTGDDDFFYEWFRLATIENGEIVITPVNEQEGPYRIRFWDCFCISVEERMSSNSACPMTIRVRLSPAIVENRGVLTQKNWKVTDLSAVKPTASSHSGKMTVADAYWIDEEGKENRELNINHSVTLYVSIKDFIAGESMDLTFEDQDEDGTWLVSNRSGIINDDGMIMLENFKLEAVTANKQDNPQ